MIHGMIKTLVYMSKQENVAVMLLALMSMHIPMVSLVLLNIASNLLYHINITPLPIFFDEVNIKKLEDTYHPSGIVCFNVNFL